MSASMAPGLVPQSDTASSGKKKVAGTLLLVATIQYWIFEAVSASSWVSPRYSYFYNFISDLGVTKARSVLQGRVLTSPLHVLTNISFVALGLLVGTAFVLISTTLERSGRTRAIGIVGAASGAGALIVASFPENTIFLVHSIGAFLFVLGGLALVIVVGSAAKLLQLNRATAVILIVLGIIGLIASLSLLFVPGFDHGATERTGGYSYLVGMVVLAIALLTQRASSPRGLERVNPRPTSSGTGDQAPESA